MTIWVTSPNILNQNDGTPGTGVLPFPIDTNQSYPKGTPIGEINFGSSSTCFVFAFHEQSLPNEYPAFHNLIEIDSTERASILSSWQTYNPNFTDDDFLFVQAESPVNESDTAVNIIYSNYDDSVTDQNSGLFLGSNGQVLGTLDIRASNKVLFFKVQTTQIPVYENNQEYYSYSYVKHGMDVYKLKADTPTPYVPSDLFPVPAFWDIVSEYSEHTDIQERTFAIIINAKSSGDIGFITDENLGTIKLGQYLGEEFNIQIKAVSATNDIITYEVHKSYVADYDSLPAVDVDGYIPSMPVGINMSHDGTLYGRPSLTTSDAGKGQFKFIVTARTSAGTEVQKLFKMTISEGYERNNVSVFLKPSRIYERAWFHLIGSESFRGIKLYRESDPKYGIQRFPKLLIKDNLYGDLGVAYPTNGQSITNIKTHLYNIFSQIDEINLKIGNIKYKTALDSNNEPQYDIIYKEIYSSSRDVPLELNSTTLNEETLYPIEGLKDLLVDTLGWNVIESSDSRYFSTTTGTTVYQDALPLWMVNPDNTNSATVGYHAVLPLAYVLPGEGEKFISAAVQENILGILYNESISFNSFEVQYSLYPGKNSDIISLN